MRNTCSSLSGASKKTHLCRLKVLIYSPSRYCIFISFTMLALYTNQTEREVIFQIRFFSFIFLQRSIFILLNHLQSIFDCVSQIGITTVLNVMLNVYFHLCCLKSCLCRAVQALVLPVRFWFDFVLYLSSPSEHLGLLLIELSEFSFHGISPIGKLPFLKFNAMHTCIKLV